MDRRDQQRQALLPPAGKLAESLRSLLFQAHRTQYVARALPGHGDPVQSRIQPRDLSDREHGLKAGRLELHADLGFRRARAGTAVDAADRDRAGIRLEQAFDGTQGGGLAGAVRTQQAEDLSGPDLKRYSVDRPGGTLDDLKIPALQRGGVHLLQQVPHPIESITRGPSTLTGP